MPVEIFTIYWILKNQAVDEPEDKANQTRAVLEKYPHWRKSESHEREVKQELRGILIQSGLKDKSKIIEIAQNVIRLLKGGVERLHLRNSNKRHELGRKKLALRPKRFVYAR